VTQRIRGVLGDKEMRRSIRKGSSRAKLTPFKVAATGALLLSSILLLFSFPDQNIVVYCFISLFVAFWCATAAYAAVVSKHHLKSMLYYLCVLISSIFGFSLIYDLLGVRESNQDIVKGDVLTSLS
jgi:hypothetical protein